MKIQFSQIITYQLKQNINRHKVISMNIFRRSVIQALMFLLLAGQLQVQHVFACGMMDAISLDDCCCEDHSNCADADCGDAMITGEVPCCEEAIVINFNHQANETLNVIKSIEIRSDVDSPTVIFAVKQMVEPNCVAVAGAQYLSFPSNLGSTTYLITQRIRI